MVWLRKQRSRGVPTMSTAVTFKADRAYIGQAGRHGHKGCS